MIFKYIKNISLLIFLFFLGITTKVFSADYYNVSNDSIQCINEFGINRAIENKIGSDIFVPTKTNTEWANFLGNKPANVFDFSTLWNASSWGTCSASPSWSGRSGRSSCSVSCGGGTQTRTRTCTNNTGTQTRNVTCNLTDGRLQVDSCCTGTRPSSTQSCSESCVGPSLETRACNTQSCHTYSWQTGSWGSCNNGTQTRTLTCKRDDGLTVNDSYCGTKPATTQTCTCASNMGSSCTISGICEARLKMGEFNGNNDGTCSTNEYWSTMSGGRTKAFTYGTGGRTCSLSTARDGKTYAYVSGSKHSGLNNCNVGGTYYRHGYRQRWDAVRVYRYPSTGYVQCSGGCGTTPPPPPPTPSYTYSWQTGSWSSCSVSCGGGIRTRSVTCKRSDGTTVSNSYCSGSKPSTRTTCNTHSCPTNDTSASIACRNRGGFTTSRSNWNSYDSRYPNLMYCCSTTTNVVDSYLTSNGWGWHGTLRAGSYGTGNYGDCNKAYSR